LVRTDWQNLNGLWKYAITPQTQRTIPTKFDGQILVPFPVESSLSGVMRMLDKNNYLWYQREFTIPENWAGRNVVLNFGAVDYTARVYVNGTFVDTHTGGFDAFSIDITSKLQAGTNTLTVMVTDNTDEISQPLGKQRFNPGGAGSIWYNQVSGIWQTVWLEPVATQYITDVHTTADVDQSQLTVNVLASATEGLQANVVLKFAGEKVAEGSAAIGTPITLNVQNAKLWSPASPNLYDMEVTLLAAGNEVDRVESYAAMRKISTRQLANGEWRMQLNNEDLFHFGPLDQGYWPDGLYTAPTDEALLYDIQKTKDWGFNMIRKHMKVEPARWYYHCDRLGLLVWQDMPALGRSDEPWVTREWSTTPGKHTTAIETAFKNQWKEIIEEHLSNPCIVVWTPFNERWGQFKTSEIVDYTRNIDNTRLINAASGGNHYEGVGDMVDLHDYDRPPHIFLYDPNRPVVLGEFGGLGRHITDHRWYENAATTYVNYDTEKKLTDAYVANTEAVITMAKDATANDGGKAAFCAAVYTQTTDVETEVNGLMTYDREVIKVDEERVREVNLRLSNVYAGSESAIRSQKVSDQGQINVYTLSGMQVDSLIRGINIVHNQDGSVNKIFCKK
jgi:beta-galactosidase/beta-glucuronidase